MRLVLYHLRVLHREEKQPNGTTHTFHTSVCSFPNCVPLQEIWEGEIVTYFKELQRRFQGRCTFVSRELLPPNVTSARCEPCRDVSSYHLSLYFSIRH